MIFIGSFKCMLQMEDVIHSRHSENQDLHPKVTHTYSSAIFKLQQNFYLKAYRIAEFII